VKLDKFKNELKFKNKMHHEASSQNSLEKSAYEKIRV
jgi:hypothetical protein